MINQKQDYVILRDVTSGIMGKLYERKVFIQQIADKTHKSFNEIVDLLEDGKLDDNKKTVPNGNLGTA